MPEVVNMNPPPTDLHDGPASTRKALRFRVDNVPLLIRPLYLAVMWIVGVVLYLYLRSLPDYVAHLNRRSRQSRSDPTFHLLHVARKLVVILRSLPALPFRSCHDQPSRRVYEAISLRLPVDGTEASAPRLIRRRRQAGREQTCETGAARLVNHNFPRRAQGPSTISEEGSSAHGATKRSANRSARHICVPLHPNAKLGFQEASPTVWQDKGGHS